METKNISVIGGGTMGNGIAHVFAMKNFNVNLVEMNQELVDKSVKIISKNLDRQIKKEIINEEDKKEILSRINKIVGLDNTPKNSDLIIEAIYENKEAKLNVFNKLNDLVKPDSLFASNTSSISIT
jgi:3-hydroxybutyryl-CoA dehydrogenase